MPEATVAEERRKLEEELARINKLLLGQQAELDQAKTNLDTRREVAVDKYSQRPKTDVFFNPQDAGPQNAVEAIFSQHGRLAMKMNKDVDEIVKEQMEGKNPYLVMLKNLLMGYGNPQAGTVRQRLFAREMKKRELQVQQINSLRSTFSSLGMLDARNRATDVSQQKTGAAIEGEGISAEASSQLAEQKSTNTLTGKVEQSRLDLARNVEQKRVESERDIAELLTGKTAQLQHDKDLAQAQADIYVARQQRLSDAGLLRPGPGAVATIPKEHQVGTHPGGKVMQEQTWNPATGAWEDIPGQDPRIEDTPKRQKAKEDVRLFFTNISQVAQNFAVELERNPETGLPTKLAIADVMKPLFGITNLFDVTLPDFAAGYDRSLNKAEFLQGHFNQVLNKVREISGQQVTNTERIYVTKTLPSLMSNSSTYGMGMELSRLWTGWRLTMLNESVVDDEHLTRLTEFDDPNDPQRLIRYKDYTGQLIRLQQIAEQIDGRKGSKLGDGSRFLTHLDARKPWAWQKVIEAYDSEKLTRYRQRRGGN